MEKIDMIVEHWEAINLWAWAVSLVTVASMLFILCWTAVFGGYWVHEPNTIILYAEIVIELTGLIALAVIGCDALRQG